MKTLQAKYYLIPAAVCLLLILGFIYYYFLSNFSERQDTCYLYIDADDTTESVFAKLDTMSTLHGMTGLRTLARHTDYHRHLHTGRYAIKPDMSTFEVFRMLKNGQQTPIMLTIPESRTLDRLAAVLSQKLMIDSASISEALFDSLRYVDWGISSYDTCSLPSLFVPNTYEVYWNISVDQLMQRLVKEHDRFWDGERAAKASALELTVNEVCTLASIIDEETANTDEKPMIAGMYLNRLHKDMPLQADPTVKFAMKNFAARRIYKNMLDFDSPYNTYRNTGLPPGPIKIASVKGIDAVLNPVEHDYLYMCAKEDFSGTHNFAATYKEHLQNAARYSKALNERGIK